MKVYEIEMKTKLGRAGETFHSQTEFRYVSFYNGARGIWRKRRQEAFEDGELHKELLFQIKK